MNHVISAHTAGQAASLHQDHAGKNKGKKESGLGSSSGVSASHKGHAHHKGVGDSKPFNADDAVNAAINLQVGMITDMADITISMSDMDTTLQQNGVANAESQVEMWRALLSAQGMCSNGGWFSTIVQGWAGANRSTYPDNAAGFENWLKAQGGGYYKQLLSGVMNNPNMTAADKDQFAQIFATWNNQCGGQYSSFLNKGSTIAQQLNLATTNVQNWQSVADSMKPTQIQQAETELMAEIGSETSMWGDVVSA